MDTQFATQAGIDVRPIQADELDRIVLRCWPEERSELEQLLATQGTIGMAAWEGERSVGILHGYQVSLPDGVAPLWPQWNDWWSGDGRALLAASPWADLAGTAWCHACCHVGRTLQSQAAARSEDGIRKGIEPRYLGRGIGTALARASVAWAGARGHRAVLAMGAPAGLREAALWFGALPWTTYSRLGFEPVDDPDRDILPEWAQGAAPPEVAAEAQAALASGRPPSAFRSRLMVRTLGR